MLLSIEPVIYFLAFLANYAEIPAVIYPEEDFDDEDGEADEVLSRITQAMEEGGVPSEVSVGGKTLQRPDAVPESLLSTDALPPRGAQEEMPPEMMMSPEEGMMDV